MARKQAPAIDRFERHFTRLDNGCWEWTAATDLRGFPRFSYWDAHGVAQCYAHRFAYTHFVGAVPENLVIHPRCRNRRCVNPDHLRAVPLRQAILDTPTHPASLNANKTHCIHGHSLSDAYTDGTKRRCRPCVIAAAREYSRRKAS